METQLTVIKSILGPKKGEKNHLSSRRNPKQVFRHMWSIADETLAIELYKSNATDEMITEAIMSLGILFSSMNMKLSNIRYLDTGEGLKNCSESLKTLWNKLK